MRESWLIKKQFYRLREAVTKGISYPEEPVLSWESICENSASQATNPRSCFVPFQEWWKRLGLKLTASSIDLTWYGIIKDETDEASNKHASLKEDDQELIQDLWPCVESLGIVSYPLRHHLQKTIC